MSLDVSLPILGPCCKESFLVQSSKSQVGLLHTKALWVICASPKEIACCIQATTKVSVQLPPAPSFSFASRKPLQPSQQNMQHGKPSGNATRPVPRPTHVQAQSQLTMAKQSEPAEQQRQGTQVKSKTAPNEAQAGPRLNFKRIRTLK